MMDEDPVKVLMIRRAVEAMRTPRKWPPLIRRVGKVNVMDLVGVGSHPDIPAHHKIIVLVFLASIGKRATEIRLEPWRFTGEECPREVAGPGFRLILEIDGETDEMPPPPRFVRTPIARTVETLAGLDRPRRRLSHFLHRCVNKIDGQSPWHRTGEFRLNLGGDAIDVEVTAYPSEKGERYFLKFASPSDALSEAATREIRRLFGLAASPLCPDLR